MQAHAGACTHAHTHTHTHRNVLVLSCWPPCVTVSTSELRAKDCQVEFHRSLWTFWLWLAPTQSWDWYGPNGKAGTTQPSYPELRLLWTQWEGLDHTANLPRTGTAIHPMGRLGPHSQPTQSWDCYGPNGKAWTTQPSYPELRLLWTQWEGLDHTTKLPTAETAVDPRGMLGPHSQASSSS